jgi:Tol biopolymer transport system component
MLWASAARGAENSPDTRRPAFEVTGRAALPWDEIDNLSWSPRGGRIAFTAYRENGDCTLCVDSAIYVMRRDGSALRRLTKWSYSGCPSWAPDGRLIAYTQGGNGAIWVMRPDGSGKRRLNYRPVADWCPTWSPGGRRLAFTRGADIQVDVFVIRRDGTRLRRLAPGARPSWSPDGHRIVYTGPESEQDKLYILELDTARVTQLVDDPLIVACPAWSRDGTRIAFLSDPDPEGSSVYPFYRLYLVNIDGTARVELPKGHSSCPTWAPGGKRLTFAGYRIYTMQPDGTDVRLIGPRG